MNILIKLMSIVSLVIAPTLAHNFQSKINNDRRQKIESLISLEKTTLSEQANKNKDQWSLITPPGADRMNSEKEIRKFIDVLEKDHLIKGDTYSVAVEKGELYINGEKQSAKINEQYKANIEATGDFITKEMQGNNP